jgi:YggT family protein
VQTAAWIIWLLALIYLLLLTARMVISLVMSFARGWRPRGAVAAAAEVVYAATDPPIRLARKVLKPVRVGDVHLDLAFFVVALLVSLVAMTAAAVVSSVP